MRSVRGGLAAAGTVSAIAMLLAAACDKEPSRLDQMLEASTNTPGPVAAADAAPAPTTSPEAGTTSAAVDGGTSGWDGSMPPRPIPKPAMTVGSGSPAEVQLKTIAYMAAMSQPRFDDAPADPEYASGLLAQLKPILLSFDKGSPEDKLRLDRVDSIGSGRRIDLLMADGCNAELPRTATQRIGASFVTLAAHGVLVIRCNDSRAQCLQSTRDPSDVLCTTAPRHR